jgi:hypothetical protein
MGLTNFNVSISLQMENKWKDNKWREPKLYLKDQIRLTLVHSLFS